MFKQYDPGDNAKLNKLTYSSGDHKNIAIKIPGEPDTTATSATTTVGDMQIKVEIDNSIDPPRQETLTSDIYKVTITSTENDGIYDDINIVTNFKKADSKEIFIKEISGSKLFTIW